MDGTIKSNYVSLEIKDERKSFRCPQCKYVTDRKNNLKRHIITMHQETSKSLECCGVVFKSKALLRDHVSLFHRGGYCCQICGRNFCRKALLHRHLTVHSGQKDFSCGQCGYATSHKSNLERHQKVHIRCSESPSSEFDHFFGLEDRRSICSEDYNTQTHCRSSRPTQPVPRRYVLLPKRLIQTYASEQSDQIYPHTEESASNKLERSTSNYQAAVNTCGKTEQKIEMDTTDSPNIQMSSATRLFLKPYKCTVCQNQYETQNQMFCHQCTLVLRHQPTLPITNAYKKGVFKHQSYKECTPVSLDEISPIRENQTMTTRGHRSQRRRLTESLLTKSSLASKLRVTEDLPEKTATTISDLLCQSSNLLRQSSNLRKPFPRLTHNELYKQNCELYHNTHNRMACVSSEHPVKCIQNIFDNNFTSLCHFSGHKLTEPPPVFSVKTFTKEQDRPLNLWRVW